MNKRGPSLYFCEEVLQRLGMVYVHGAMVIAPCEGVLIKQEKEDFFFLLDSPENANKAVHHEH